MPRSENTDGTFEQFTGLAHGIRAMMVALRNYQIRYQLHSIEAIIRRWSVTDQDSYIRFVSKKMQMEPSDFIDLTNSYLLMKLTRAMVEFENGSIPALVTDDVFEEAKGLV